MMFLIKFLTCAMCIMPSLASARYGRNKLLNSIYKRSVDPKEANGYSFAWDFTKVQITQRVFNTEETYSTVPKVMVYATNSNAHRLTLDHVAKYISDTSTDGLDGGKDVYYDSDGTLCCTVSADQIAQKLGWRVRYGPISMAYFRQQDREARRVQQPKTHEDVEPTETSWWSETSFPEPSFTEEPVITPLNRPESDDLAAGAEVPAEHSATHVEPGHYRMYSLSDTVEVEALAAVSYRGWFESIPAETTDTAKPPESSPAASPAEAAGDDGRRRLAETPLEKRLGKSLRA